ncbi:hypothetical protein CsSME_00039805 [Camellia sinensis var. sinensis]
MSLFCFWIYRQKKLKNSIAKSQQSRDAVNGISLGLILGRFNSLRMADKKGFSALINYQLLVATTNNFQ